ncbi:hypothetical protein MJO52_17670 [Microbulbifer variabilis]|uniref:Uncharacterized protein n=1 Tax=Microbulbifer variabilis TaxID=266805 RepID=A0ABY4V9A2_9GAMM|nr:hypothetical protein [Microbulbifer variabilis]USD20869.1 hypothetical protein MJO52_17670 [Microbulbifer variabilis]
MPAFRAGWTKIIEMAPMGTKQGRDVYVNNAHYPMYEKVKQEAQTNYYSATLLRALISLNADTGSSQSANGAGTIRYLVRHGMAIEYFIDNGDVLIHKLHYDDSLQPNTGSQTTGVYKVRHDGNAWKTNSIPLDKMQHKHKWNGAHYAAVSGKFGSNNSAGRILIKHIEKAYGGTEILPRDITKVDNHYSLYWINKGEHGALPSVDGLTSLIQQAADARESVNWLVHGEGAKTLQRALEILQTAPSLSRFAAKDEEIMRGLRMKMAGQKIFLSNPVGANPDKIEKLCSVVGLTYVNKNINTRNFKTTGAWRNSWGEIKKIGATAMAIGFATTVSKKSGVYYLQKQGELMGESFGAAMTNTSSITIATAGASVAAVYVFAQSQFTKWNDHYRAIRATASSTFGRGNEYWYESDKDLLEQLSG